VRLTDLFQLPIFDDQAKKLIGNFVHDALMNLQILPPKGEQLELRINLPTGSYLLSGQSEGRVKPIRIPESSQAAEWSLVTFGRSDPQTGASWYLGHLFGNGDSLQILNGGLLGGFFDRPFCTCDLPDLRGFSEIAVQPSPVLSVDITSEDGGKKVTSSRWRMSGVALPLDQTLG